MTTFNYTGTFERSVVNRMTLPAHMVALLIADKLGQPIPVDNHRCVVNGDDEVVITYDVAGDVQDDVPLTITIPDAPPVAEPVTHDGEPVTVDGKPLEFGGTTEADLS